MSDYEHYSREELLHRITELEKQLAALSPQKDISAVPGPIKSTPLPGKIFGSQVLEALPDMLSVLDRDGNYIELVSSEKTVHVGGCSADMTGRNIRDFLPEEAYQIIKSNLDRVIASRTVGIDRHSLPVEGKKHLFENRIIPLDMDHVLCICRDVTEAMKTQRQLEMVESAVNNSIEEIYACTTDGRLMFANTQFCNSYRLNGNIHRYKIYEVYPEINRDAWETHIRKLKQEGGYMKYTAHHRHSDGTKVILDITTYIVSDFDGQEIVWNFGRDVSESIRQQKKIRELNYIMETILNNVPVYLFVKDTGNDFRYLYWNKAFEEYSHIPADKVLGRKDEEIFPRKEDARKFREDDLRLLEEGRKIEYQEEYVTATGETRIVNTIKILVPAEDTPPLIIGIAWDITELKNTEKARIEARMKAEQSDKLKTAFLANMSHEIRTPLNAIVGFSRLIVETDDPEIQKQYDAIINKNTDLLLQLINDILDLSKIEAGTLEFVKKPVDVKELCKNLYDIHSYKTPPGVKLLFDENSPEITIVSDNNRLAQVLSNLLTNAQKFTTKGEIRFGYERKGKNIEFYVRDTGIGIAPRDINAIFNRFMKLNTFAQGSGLGLSICRMIVENLGGDIWAESIPGKGSVFRFTLPENKETYLPQNDNFISTSLMEKKETNKRKVILVAEDVNSNFLLINALLHKEYDLARAENGKEVVELSRSVNPDLILMDIKMPEMDGLEATRIIRKERKDLPIIALTAFAFEADRTEALQAGCNDFLTKPVSATELKQTLKKYL